MNKNQISLQVYTARNFKPYENIFKFLSESDLENVELFEVEAFDETKELLDNKHVAVSPGDTFGTNTNQYIRISLASDEETIRNGVTRLCEFIKSS